VLLRLVRASGDRRLKGPPGHRGWARLSALACTALLAAACDRGTPLGSEVSLTWRFAPDPPAVGPSRLTLRIDDDRGQPLRGARVRLEANMTHPGMRPVVADAIEAAPGRYEVDLDFTMAGSWFILLTGEKPQGGAFSRRIDVAHVRGR
jgi:hypothetical protein